MDASPEVLRCRWCRKLLKPTARRDSLYCCKSHRQAAWRFGRSIQEATRAARPLRLAVADPPYPGLSRRYYGSHPDFAGEVDHIALLLRLSAYDGWVLCTSSDALPGLLALCVAQDLRVRIAVWVRGVRSNKATAPLHGWEAVVYVPARSVVSSEPGCDVLIYPARARLSDPNRVTGAKPAPYIAWIFQLLGARPGDQLDDLYPGSGGFLRAWAIYNERSLTPGGDTSPEGETNAP